MNDDRRFKTILALCRPGTSDLDDPLVQEALSNPAMADWYRGHAASYRSIRTKFTSIPIPPDLKNRIVSGYSPPHAAIIPFGTWRALRLAASIALCAGLAVLTLNFHRRATGFETYRTRMVRTALQGYNMELASGDLAAINQYLVKHQSPALPDLPAGLKSAQLVGCAVFHWQGAPVSMFCFRSGRPLAAGENTDLWLFVIDQSSLAGTPKISRPVLEQIKKLETASWTHKGKTFVLAADGDEAFLRAFL